MASLKFGNFLNPPPPPCMTSFMNAHLESAMKRQDLNYKHLKKRHLRQKLMKLLAQMLLPSSQKHKYSNHSIPGYSRETNGGTVH